MKILFSGGGTLGPVTPLLGVKETIEKNNNFKKLEFLWIGTKTGPEKFFLQKINIKFYSILSAKYRRYFSFWNIIDIFKLKIAFFQSFFILLKEKPDLCISAGGFVSVPVHFSAWLLGIPTWVHQQDYEIGLANKIMKKFSNIITVTLEKHLKNMPKNKTFWLGNPIRKDILKGKKEEAIKLFNLKKDLPVIFVTGGGTGSLRINQMILETVPHLKGLVQIIHLSGRTREKDFLKNTEKLYDFYKVYDFFGEEMKHAYKIADIIVSRGGFGTLTEISALQKPAIIIPKPGHQEKNVDFFKKQNAIISINENFSNGLNLAQEIKNLLKNSKLKENLAKNLHNILKIARDEDIIKILNKLIK